MKNVPYSARIGERLEGPFTVRKWNVVCHRVLTEAQIVIIFNFTHYSILEAYQTNPNSIYYA